jgi:hypothetical protein
VNQQPHGALQEQASSSSPETFQETLGAEESAAWVAPMQSAIKAAKSAV